MPNLRTFISIVFLLVAQIAFTQEFRISGILLNADDQQPLVGATVKLISLQDSSQFKYTASGMAGDFEFTKLNKGSYMLDISYVGFERHRQTVSAGGKTENLGKIIIHPSLTNLKEVDISGTAIRAEQKGDTTQYNSSAFKVSQDATTEDLIKKMPGITIENGTVKAHGEDVKKVLVDGKQFFGDDPSVTLKNLPAEVVDKIQVFDKLSDQAAWTGFDDGNSKKTINIVTKNGKNTGQFGKFSAGYGTDDRYMLGANINFFKGARRITLLGMSNNVNQQNFSADDVLGSTGGGRGQGGPMRRGGGGGGFQAGPQSGIFSTNALGFNYTNVWGTKLTLNASYFWNNGTSNNNTITNRQYVLGGDANQYYNELSQSKTINTNHRVNMRIEYSLDTNNSFILTPRLSLQDNNSTSFLDGKTSSLPEFILSNLVNSTLNNNKSNGIGYNFNNDLLYRHRFAKKGRTISINASTGVNNRNRDNYVNSLSVNYLQVHGNANDTMDQKANSLTNGLSLS